MLIALSQQAQEVKEHEQAHYRMLSMQGLTLLPTGALLLRQWGRPIRWRWAAPNAPWKLRICLALTSWQHLETKMAWEMQVHANPPIKVQVNINKRYLFHKKNGYVFRVYQTWTSEGRCSLWTCSCFRSYPDFIPCVPQCQGYCSKRCVFLAS